MSTKSRLNPRPIIAGHLATLRDPNTGFRLRDITEQFLLPLVVGAAAAICGIKVSGTTAAALLTLAGIFAAFFFQLSVQLLDRAAAWAESDPQPGPETTRYALLLEDLSANTTYAALIAALAAIAALAVGISNAGWPERLCAGIAGAMLVHLATTLFLVATRVFLLTRARLNAARAGRNRTV